MLTIKENVNNVDEFNYLYDAVDWGSYDYEISKRALDNTYYSVSVYDDNKIIGYGRLIGDTICFMYVHDIIVIPEYQGQKIGAMIMNKLIKKIKKLKKENPDMRVYTGASKGKEGFYRKFGFIDRDEAGLGAGMIFKD